MGTSDNVVQMKSENFAIAVVNAYKDLTLTKNEFILSKQLLRSGTSIGANIAESECASSENDFVNKLYIALKECNESLYWLRLLYKTDYIGKERFNTLYRDCSEIKRILTSSVKTIRERQESGK
ncbi:MAG: four helix bundle protein [Clostridia bacterium]|nr:four helix bundle protein [Clostridia bacterium]